MPTEPKAIVIGAGFGGIAAALRLRKKGYAVTIIDKQTQLGGRATVYRRNGYTFDAGPTVVTAHFLFDELFTLFGKKREDYINFVPVYPWYSICFHDGSKFDYGGTLEQTLAEIRRISPPDEQGYLKLLEHTKRIFDVGFTQLGDVPFDSLTSMLKIAPQMITLGVWRTVWQMASKYIQSDKLRRVFSFQPLLVGGNPFHTTSIYSLIQYLEREWGVHFAMGGTAAIVSGLEKLMREEGIEIRLDEEVVEAPIHNHRSPSGDFRLHGVQLRGEKTIQGNEYIAFGPADILVWNGDPPVFYKHVLDIQSGYHGRWPGKKIDKLKYSMGLFVLYFGTTKQFPEVAHHTILLGDKYSQLLHEMFDLKQLEMSDFSIYLHRPTATDPSMAPPGCDSFYALVPVPNLQVPRKRGHKPISANAAKHGENENSVKKASDPFFAGWASIGDDYRNRVVAHLEKTALPGLSQCIVEDFYVTPEHFRDNLNTMHGTGFSIQPTFMQSAYFRFHNRSEDIEGLYFVGAGTHPGAGMPGVLCSAKVLDRIVPDAHGQRPTDDVASLDP